MNDEEIIVEKERIKKITEEINIIKKQILEQEEILDDLLYKDNLSEEENGAEE